ncbi:MAG: hypothetical protein RSA20_11520, partial [Oscillospiraceae bacterium]
RGDGFPAAAVGSPFQVPDDFPALPIVQQTAHSLFQRVSCLTLRCRNRDRKGEYRAAIKKYFFSIF